jgi:hypothetical protein
MIFADLIRNKKEAIKRSLARESLILLLTAYVNYKVEATELLIWPRAHSMKKCIGLCTGHCLSHKCRVEFSRTAVFY